MSQQNDSLPSEDPESPRSGESESIFSQTPTFQQKVELTPQEDYNAPEVKLRLPRYKALREKLKNIVNSKPTIFQKVIFWVGQLSIALSLALIGNLVYSKKWPKDEPGLYVFALASMLVYTAIQIYGSSKLSSIFKNLNEILEMLPENLVDTKSGAPFPQKNKSNKRRKK